MDKVSNDIYNSAKQYLIEHYEIPVKNINDDVLEFVCKYRYSKEHCIKSRLTIYNELIKFFNKTMINTIMHLINALDKGADSEVHIQWQPYFNSIWHAQNLHLP